VLHPTVGGYLDIAVAAQQQPQGNPGLKPSQRRAQTEVNPMAEAQVRVGRPVDVEPIGTREHPLVPIGGAEPGHDDLASGDGHTTEHGVDPDEPGQPWEGRANPQNFLDRPREQLRARPELGDRGGVVLEVSTLLPSVALVVMCPASSNKPTNPMISSSANRCPSTSAATS
jgi:hypothetical protein